MKTCSTPLRTFAKAKHTVAYLMILVDHTFFTKEAGVLTYSTISESVGKAVLQEKEEQSQKC